MGSRRVVTRLQSRVVALLATLLIVPVLAGGLPAGAALVPAAVSATQNQFGFPTWYQDTTGTRVQPCLEVNDPMCTLLAAPGVFDPSQPIALPTNFPPEFFYTVADSTKLTTPGCAGTAPGTAFVRLATEGSFVNGDPAPGEQTTFGRIRIVVTGGLCPNHDYTITHPYGTTTIHTDAAGALAKRDGTTDAGCLLFAAPATCDFSLALTSPVVKSFLRWDPAIAPAAPAGYLGDPGVAHAITGGSAANIFSIVDAGVEVLRTDQFTVMGKEAGPIAAPTSLVEFGPQHVSTASAPQLVALTNLAATPVTLGALSTTPAQFAVTDPNACAGRVLARDESCAVSVAFSPLLVGPLTGTLSVTSNGVRSPFTLALAGTGTNPGQEALLTASPTSLLFGPTRIRTQSVAQRVRVSNTGTAPLLVSATDLVDTTVSGDRLQFAVTSDACRGVSVQPNSKCDINIVFRPTVNGAVTAALKLTANISTGPVQIPLTATGTGGVASVSTTIDAGTGYPDWYQDELGVRLSECIDPADANCTVLPDAFYDPAKPLVGVPSFSNFPTEFFYHVATSDIVSTPGCAGTAPGKALMRSALEGSFTTGVPRSGDQMVFGRIRVRVSSGLCPNTPYTFTHPYGQVTLTTDSAGGIKPAAGTSDVGCFPVAPAVCDWTQAISAPVSAGYLSWAPTVAPAAPAGYLGNPLVLHAVTGSGYTAPGDTTPANYFRIDGPTATGGPSVQVGKTSLFTVMGKLNGPLMASPSLVSFPAQSVATTSAAQAVTFTNAGIAPVTVTSATVAGTNAAEFAADAGCVGVTLAVAATCVVNVTFTPSTTGTRAAALDVVHSGLNSPLRVGLTGIGLAGGLQPAVSLSPMGATFVDLHTAQTSAPQTITVSNLGGQAPLVVGVPTINSTQYALQNNCLAPVAIDANCTIDVRFTPNAAGPAPATLSIPTNVAGTPVATATLQGRGFAGAPAVSATVRAADGFPEWYQDDNGVRVEPCLQLADPNCVVLATPGFDPTLPVVFPTNFPGEFFYQLADSALLPTDGCGGTTAPGTALLRMALEGSFLTGAQIPGDQITFGRVRVSVTSGLCANTSYRFITPYGLVGPFLTNGVGGLARNTGTTDIGGAPFTAALASPALSAGLVRWDPAVAPIAPAGYLGDATSFHRIVGARYTAPGDANPANYFSVDGTTMKTDKFAVSGKLAGPITATPSNLAFGNVNVNATSADQTVTVTNVSSNPVSGFTPTLGGANPADFAITGGTCGVGAVGLDQTCTVTVHFAPTTAGNKTASLTVAHSGTNSPTTVSLSGSAISVATPAVALTPTSVNFASRDAGTVSAPVSVTVTNTGTATLHVTAAALIGADLSQFRLTNGCTLAVAPTATCTLQVSFAPTSGGAKAAQIQLTDDAPTSPQLVSLSGTGVSASLSTSPSSLSFSAGVGGSSSKSLKITNTGTANLAISSLTITGSPTFTIASQNCTAALAPRKSCTVNVRFAPTSRTSFTGALNIVSNATPATVPLTGTGK